METPGSGLLQQQRHYLSRPSSKTINPRFNMLTQSNDHRSLVRIALVGFAVGINGGLKKKKYLRLDLVPAGILSSAEAMVPLPA